jgi:hypothetical protein
MSYDLIIERRYCDSKRHNNIETWKQVTDILKRGLDYGTIAVDIYKHSSNNRLLGYKKVVMMNFYSVISSETDKILD